ncbi:MAG TPA: prepilin-type N-terminal cleavage/methylation domain-containing protein [Verrucomicrobiae bacterium]|nr:prepilin-type N-terminal cleavage/methylation domain-containing protein [Verrucomicrobiae bacterium]
MPSRRSPPNSLKASVKIRQNTIEGARPVGFRPFSLAVSGARRKETIRGLTLIELLIVVAVLGLLALLLFPSLARARQKALQAECLSRLRQWGIAFNHYAEDNNGRIARECYEPLGEVTINNWSQVKGRPRPDGTTDSLDVWYNALPPELNQVATIRYAALADRIRFFDTRNLIHCPAARFPKHALRPTYQFPLFSMAMNSQLIQSGPSIRLSTIEAGDPARTVLFLDNLLEGEPRVHSAQERTHLGQPGAYANRFGPRHDDGGNLAFADGHAGWFRGRDVVQTEEGNPLVGGPILPPRDIVWEISLP